MDGDSATGETDALDVTALEDGQYTIKIFAKDVNGDKQIIVIRLLVCREINLGGGKDYGF